MNRTDLLSFESSSTRRMYTGKPEIRASADGKGLTYDGHAFTSEQPYDVYGGPPYGWSETMARGSAKKTLKEGADVAFLVNHGGLTLARTKSGTLQLNEDSIGLHVLANLDPGMSEVNSLRIASGRGDIDEMSFGFRVVKDAWFDDKGNASNSYEGTQRRILEINLDKGDVSAVNYGANPNTSGAFRELDCALIELRSGRALAPEQRDLIRNLANALDPEEPEDRMNTRDDQTLLNAFKALELAVVALRAEIETDVADDTAGPDGSQLPGETNSFEPVLKPEGVTAMRSLWDARMSA